MSSRFSFVLVSSSGFGLLKRLFSFVQTMERKREKRERERRIEYVYKFVEVFFFFSSFVFYGVEKRKRIHLKYYVLK